MGTGKLSRLRVLTLLLAFGIGLLGQVVMTAAMAMPIQMLPKQTMEASGGPGGCPACPSDNEVPASPAMALCAATFCTGLPAILSPEPLVALAVHPAFPPSKSADGTGLTVRPDLGPPRTILHT
jgi:hypothetical protein